MVINIIDWWADRWYTVRYDILFIIDFVSVSIIDDLDLIA